MDDNPGQHDPELADFSALTRFYCCVGEETGVLVKL
jgi:hypothetical protein